LTEALVLGGSIAGLLAAAALSPAVDEVVLVERDDLTAGAGRRGVPQGTQVHALLAAGQRAMETLLPGIVEEFVAAGGRLLDSPHEIAIFGSQGWAGRMPSAMQVVFSRRPVLEAAFFDTSALRSPGIAAKVQAWIAAGRSPAPQDPSSVPPPLTVPQAGEAR
jgi:2-polyprenyl-6-methoxyphenol hydroxylase-like FAD-dependent oxidoreductase